MPKPCYPGPDQEAAPGRRANASRGPTTRSVIFPTPRGRLWRVRTFYRDIWKPTQVASGLDIRPHECRHSYVTHLRGAAVNDADLAKVLGHRLETMLAHYSHPLGNSFVKIRSAVDREEPQET